MISFPAKFHIEAVFKGLLNLVSELVVFKKSTVKYGIFRSYSQLGCEQLDKSFWIWVGNCNQSLSKTESDRMPRKCGFCLFAPIFSACRVDIYIIISQKFTNYKGKLTMKLNSFSMQYL